jgi:hypothetical protein
MLMLWKHQWPKLGMHLTSFTQKPNAKGKGRPHGFAEESDGVGVPLTAQLGWGAEWKMV